MPGHGWSADPNGKFVHVSPRTLNFIGQPAENLNRIEGTDDCGWRQVVHPDDYDRVAARWLRSLRTGAPYESEHRIRRFDGAYRWFRDVAMPSCDDHGRVVGWCGTMIDIEEQKQAEAALRNHERELSQVVDLVPSRLWRLSPVGEPIFFHKRMVYRLMADEFARKNIRVGTDFYRSLPQVLIDPVQMAQVLINLIRNAIDALDTIVDGTKLIQIHAVLDGDNTIRVEFRDVGSGVKEPDRIFEPYFTTKENGMGLAICRSIIESHNGRLWAISNQPRGTILAFTLPIQARDAA